MTDCALPCFMFTCVPSGNVKLIPDIGSAASAKPSAPSAVTGRNIEPVVSEDGSSRSYLALFWDSRICLFASPTLSPRACIHLVMPRWYTWISLRKEVRRTLESWLSRTRYFFHAHSYRSSAVILLKILIWRQRYNDKRTCTRLHRGYAYIFPHCYIKATSKELLIYDTIKFSSIYMRNIVVPYKAVNTLNQFGYIDDCDDNKTILQKIANNGVGYFIQPNKSMPYFPKRGLQIMTSLNKENKALGHNLASYTNMMLKSITFLLNNTLSKNLNSFAYKQLEYPNVNHTEIDIDTILLQLISFDLERIVLSGEISCDKLERILNLAQTRNILVVFRVHYLAYPIQHIQDMLRKYRTIMVELLIDSATPLDIINLREERLILKYIVTNNSDLDKLTGAKENIVLCPIFLDEKNITLQPQMVITKDEVLKINQNLKDCYLKDYINTSYFGHITINYDGMVYCVNQQIESLQNRDLACIINNWVGSQDCYWYFTRNKKLECKDCALQVLCPSISIYEQLKIYKCPCRV